MEILQVLARLALALVIGGAIGYEREFKNRPAGLRTHILVCVGAAIISMIQIYSMKETLTLILQNPQLEGALKADVGRMGAQVISGIGFLGAGTIMHQKGSIRGLTTAASLWVVACLGLAIGMGYYVLSVLSGISVVIVLVTLKQFETRFFEKQSQYKIEIQYSNRRETFDSLEEYFSSREIKIKNIEFGIEEESDEVQKYSTSLYTIMVPKHIESTKIMHDLMKKNEIVKVNII
jgi:putative Mg2+ transporter-C (MgtC) family protein